MQKVNKSKEIKKPNPNQDNIFFNKKIVAPEKLKILVLSGNDIVNDELEFIHKCTNLLKLDISNNHITKIMPKSRMGDLKKLQILYLHNNRIENMNSLQGIFYVPSLVHLTINNNPVQKTPRIQHLIINMLPTLKVINQRVVFVEERSADVFKARNNVFIQSELVEGWKSQDNQQAHYMNVLELQLRYFQNVWYFNNPIIQIQRYWRNKCQELKSKKKVLKRKNPHPQLIQVKSQEFNVLYTYFDTWRQFLRQRKAVRQALKKQDVYQDKSYLTYPHQEYILAQRNFRINGILRKYLQHIRHHIFVRRMAEKIKWQLQKKQHEFNSPYSFFENSGIAKSKRFYFSKIQSHLLENLLAHMGKNFNWRQRIYNSTSTGSVQHYLSIRLVDPQTYAVKSVYSTLTYLMWPSMKVIFLKKKKSESTQKTGFIRIRPLIYIKNKNKHVTKEQYRKSCKIYRKLQKFYKKEYMVSLDYFQCTDDQIMKMLIRYIYYHNNRTYEFPKILEKNQMQSLLQSYEEPLVIYAEDIVKRTAAAVRIQQNWRRYLIQKNQKDSIYAKMKATRAVYRIQRFWRDQVFYHRLSFHKFMSHQLKNYTQPTILIPQQIYLNIQTICQLGNKTLLYNDLEILLDRSSSKIKGSWQFDNLIIPSYIQEKFLGKVEPNFSFASNTTIKAYQIIHFEARVVSKLYNGHNYIQFEYQSTEECRQRIYLLALLSYRIYGSLMFLPLSKQTLHLQSSRINSYNKLLKSCKIPIAIKQSNSRNAPSQIKILRKIHEHGLFLFAQDKEARIFKQNNKQPKIHKVNLEFYQKMFRDYPRKFVTNLSYIYTQDIYEELQKQAKHKNQEIEALIKENQISDNEESQIKDQQSKLKNKTINNIMNDSDKMKDAFYVSKIDKKKVSMYEIGSKTGINFREEISSIPQDRNFATAVEMSLRKNNISQIRVEQKNKRKQIMERKKANLTQLQEKTKQEKEFISNLRNLKEMERTQVMRRKVDRVKSFKNRLSSTKKRQSEDDFIQQGNFVMQQQLKMIIMKQKMTVKANMSAGINQWGSRKHRSFMVNSELTDKKNQAIQTKNETVNIRINQISEDRASLFNDDLGNEGGEIKIVNTRTNLKKNRAQSIGAYLRDPSFVHGVFPQQYYPIDNKRATFKFFPPL